MPPVFKKSYVKNAVTVLTAVLLCLSLFVSCSKNEDISLYTPQNTTLPVAELSGVVDKSEISAKSAILIESSSDQCIWEKNSDQKLPMASTTKIMTAIVALESGDIKRKVSVSPLAVGVEGSSVYLYEGEQLTLEQLLYAMLLSSANDAAAAIAIEVGGSVENFARLMNRKAENLGLSNTSFENPHGLDGENHYTTAADLAIIARCAMQNTTFREIVSTYKTTIPLGDDEGVRLLVNHNKLLKSYEGTIGIKTGFTKKSGRCLVSAAVADGVEYICVTLNAPNDWSDHKKLYDYASSLYTREVLCTPESVEYSLPVSNGTCDFVTVKNKVGHSLILPKNHGEISYRINLPRFVLPEVKSGDILGEIVFFMDGKEIWQTPLYAYGDVPKKPKGKLFFGGS